MFGLNQNQYIQRAGVSVVSAEFRRGVRVFILTFFINFDRSWAVCSVRETQLVRVEYREKLVSAKPCDLEF